MRITIYFLSDASTGNIHYVGATKSSLKNRLKAHRWAVGSRKLTALKASGIKLQIGKLDECAVSESAFYENYWIDQMRAWGFTLTNDYRYHKYSYPKLKEDLLKLT